jgi:c-di-GMP-binding flagellar brake protein YcgR
VHALLRQFVEGDVPLALTAPDGTYYSTTLWADDQARGVLVFSADPGDLRVHRLIEAEEVVAVGYLDAVKVQFDVHGLVLVHGRDASALNAEYPGELFRFQRRGNFRVRPLTHAQPTARLAHPGVPGMLLTLRVMDVSQGGAAVFLPDDVPTLACGSILPNVRLDLDPQTRLQVGLRVIHVATVSTHSRGIRLGCELIGLGSEGVRALQRYIDQTQKRRRLFTL